MFKNGLFKFVAVIALVMSLSACASSRSETPMVSDPFEPMNRAVFSFNTVLDKVLLNPLAKAYKAVMPNVVRDSFRNFFRNLATPVTLANNLLQGDMEAAGVTTARFLFNTVIGVGGLRDFAETQGLEYEPEDFGQTLAVWGVDKGPYLVLPVLGPSTLRDASGLFVDHMADPIRVVEKRSDREWLYYSRTILQALDAKSRVVDGMEDLRKNSFDYYGAVKSSYIQARIKLIYEGKTGVENKSVQIPSYDDFE